MSGNPKAANTRSRAKGLGTRPQDLGMFCEMGPLEQREQIREGMAAMIVSRIAAELLHVPVHTLLRGIGLSSSTVLRKISKAGRLSSAESDRIARVLYTFDRALDVFADKAVAAEWILRPNAELAGVRPLEVLDTQPGYDRVRDLLMRITFGLPV
ncbi:hypothetical protein WM03_08525 [Burkholderia ubonensis]|nr:hypothetical protein WJ65_06785 [Burkholderia ubonensis]KWI20113.1 hypothetical protein WM02_03820 [Burkholderia ubonensis]KWI33719.1 hypothetical protein WM03_08525 [Burkholderia ubonensis]ODQ34632.1 hypothetical protein BGV63_20695 [Burkholderia ubonensis]OJA32963.1 hypothetical protein BGV58_03285 [Burkholderia ubonensis]